MEVPGQNGNIDKGDKPFWKQQHQLWSGFIIIRLIKAQKSLKIYANLFLNLLAM